MLQVDYIVCAFLFHDTDQESEQEQMLMLMRMKQTLSDHFIVSIFIL